MGMGEQMTSWDVMGAAGMGQSLWKQLLLLPVAQLG